MRPEWSTISSAPCSLHFVAQAMILDVIAPEYSTSSFLPSLGMSQLHAINFDRIELHSAVIVKPFASAAFSFSPCSLFLFSTSWLYIPVLVA